MMAYPTYYLCECTTNESFQMISQITDGDYMDIYKNLCNEDDAMLSIFIIIAIIGVVVYLRGRKQ